MLHVSGGVLVGLGVAAGSFSIVLAAFARHTSPEQRSMVFGIGTAAGSAGMFLFAPHQPGADRRLWLVGQRWSTWRSPMLVIPVLAIPLVGNSRSGTGLAGRDRADARPGAVGSLRPQELPAACLRLLRLRLPGRLHHRPFPGLYRRHRHRRALCGDRAGADRLLQHHRLARLRRHRPALFQADLPRLDLSRPVRSR